ncbi:hypothetical protein PFISCL1PPCAC_22803 [Pristionchus fissidentatus]|uniref:Uncharacterized protein n=1 Tax=Pristionchus fissidentatus TaxID=1538716 RepID=A0AAV5WKN8_9BILA|nr:hypothetical protein PFISCL1PPCAC_22803 [Pristionchus fissidentatus]
MIGAFLISHKPNNLLYLNKYSCTSTKSERGGAFGTVPSFAGIVPTLLLLLLVVLLRGAVDEELREDDGVEQGGNGESANQQRITRLLDRGEDAGDRASQLHDARDDGEDAGRAGRVTLPDLQTLADDDNGDACCLQQLQHAHRHVATLNDEEGGPAHGEEGEGERFIGRVVEDLHDHHDDLEGDEERVAPLTEDESLRVRVGGGRGGTEQRQQLRAQRQALGRLGGVDGGNLREEEHARAGGDGETEQTGEHQRQACA